MVSRFSDFSRRMNHGLRIVIIKQTGAQSCVTNLAAYFELKKVEIQNVLAQLSNILGKQWNSSYFLKFTKDFSPTK